MYDRTKKALPPLLSVLDRLINDDPTLSVEVPKTNNQLTRELKQSVRRDLENLLNTRWRCTGWPEHLEELNFSLVNYGLPDFTGASRKATEDPEVFCRIIETAIAMFEPRLKNVRVDPLENTQPLDRTWRFKINATLYCDPIEDRVAYNSSVEPTSGNFQIEGGGS